MTIAIIHSFFQLGLHGSTLPIGVVSPTQRGYTKTLSNNDLRLRNYNNSSSANNNSSESQNHFYHHPNSQQQQRRLNHLRKAARRRFFLSFFLCIAFFPVPCRCSASRSLLCCCCCCCPFFHVVHFFEPIRVHWHKSKGGVQEFDCCCYLLRMRGE